MTPTPHGQVPEALIDLIDAYAETRHRCGGIYNAKTEAARKAVIEALSGMQALSAAPAGFVPVAAFDRLHAHAESLAARLLAATPTPPAEQQAPKAAPGVGSSGFDYQTAADFLSGKTVSDEAVRKFVATSRWAHDERAALSATLLAMHGVLTSREAEIALLKKALLEAEAVPKAAPGDAIDEAMRERDDAEDFIDALLDEVLGHERPEWSSSYGRADALNDVQERMTALHKPAVNKAWGQFQSAMAAPQQEAQEPCPTCAALARTVMLDQVSFDRKPDCYGIRQITDDEGVEEWEDIRASPDVAREEANDMMATGRGEICEVAPLWTTPQPSPTPQADSQPAHQWDTGYPPLPATYYLAGGAVRTWDEGQMRAYVDADRTARAQADSVTAPAGVAVAGPGRKCMGLRCMASAENGYAHSRECIDEVGEAQVWKPTAEDYAKCGPSAPTPPAQAADTVPYPVSREDQP